METFDVVVIGGGPGGYPAAIRAAQRGASVALVEKEYLGGVCLNWGCIPTKALIASADLLRQIGEAAEFGIAVKNVQHDYAAILRRKEGIVAKLRKGVEQLLESNGVCVFRGTASFESRSRIAISPVRSAKANAGTRQAIQAHDAIIATGSRSAIPSFIPKSGRIIDSKGFLSRKKLPESLIVCGGGVIGCEMACLAAQLGVQVTVVELLEDILVNVDRDVRRIVKDRMESLNIRILTGSGLSKVKADQNRVKAASGSTSVEADLLLVAVGRHPVTEGLHLDRVGVERDERGYIRTDDFCATSAPGIFAVGDVSGGVLLAHNATSEGIVAAENAAGSKRVARERMVPECIFTSPEIGRVGLTEEQAREQKKNVVSGKFPFAALGKAIIEGDERGFVKWIVDKDTHQLLGAQAVGRHAAELIAEAAVAVRGEFTARELGSTIHAHPTFSEAWMEAAHAAEGDCIHLPRRKR